MIPRTDGPQSVRMRIGLELLSGPVSLAALMKATGASKQHVWGILQRQIEAGEVERVVLLTDEGAEVRYRPSPTWRFAGAVRSGQAGVWLWCERCRQHQELAGARDWLRMLPAALTVRAARLIGVCESCRRRAGELPPIPHI